MSSLGFGLSLPGMSWKAAAGGGGGGGGGTDPSYSSVGYLLRFNGVDAATTTTDEKGAVVTAAGTPTISTLQSKWGGSSTLFPATGYNAWTMPSVPAVNGFATTGLWTWECWVYIPTAAAGTNKALAFVQVGGGFELKINASDCVFLAARNDHTVMTSVTAIPKDQWVHIAITRNTGNVHTIWQNGVSVASATDSYSWTDGIWQIGGESSTTQSLFLSFMDDCRYTKGVCRYTGAFTPPTAQFPNA